MPKSGGAEQKWNRQTRASGSHALPARGRPREPRCTRSPTVNTGGDGRSSVRVEVLFSEDNCLRNDSRHPVREIAVRPVAL